MGKRIKDKIKTFFFCIGPSMTNMMFDHRHSRYKLIMQCVIKNN